MKFFITLLNLFCFFNIFSQDLFLMNNGNEMSRKLVKIDNTLIYYYNIYDSINIRTISKSDVFRISLQNGEKILIKPETVYPPVVYEDMLIFTDGRDLKVKVVSVEGENVTYLFDNKENSINVSQVKFIKFKDGKILKGNDLIIYEDKIILLNGDELQDIKYKDSTSTDFIYQEKNQQSISQISFTEVFVVKLANGEKVFPPKEIEIIKEKELTKKDTIKKKEPITDQTKIIVTPQVPVIQPVKYDKIKLKSGETVKGKFLNFDEKNVNYLNINELKKTIPIVDVSYILDENEDEIKLPAKEQSKKSTLNTKSKADFRNFALSLSHQEKLGFTTLGTSFGASAMGTYGFCFGYRYHNRIETSFEPVYSNFAYVEDDNNIELNIKKEQLGIYAINRFYLTKRFNFQLSLGINRDLSLQFRGKPSGSSSYTDWYKLSTSDLSKRFHLGIQPGFGWKGRRLAFDFVFQNLDLKGSSSVSTANANLFGFRFEILLYNTNHLNN